LRGGKSLSFEERDSLVKPFIIYSANTKIKSVLWGVFFILFGLILEIGMIILFIEEGFSLLKIIGVFFFALIISAGFHSINLTRYPIVLSADEKGIHYFVVSGRLGFGKKEIFVSWREIKKIIERNFLEKGDEDYENYVDIYIELEDGCGGFSINLNDANISMEKNAEIVSKLNKMSKFYKSLNH